MRTERLEVLSSVEALALSSSSATPWQPAELRVVERRAALVARRRLELPLPPSCWIVTGNCNTPERVSGAGESAIAFMLSAEQTHEENCSTQAIPDGKVFACCEALRREALRLCCRQATRLGKRRHTHMASQPRRTPTTTGTYDLSLLDSKLRIVTRRTVGACSRFAPAKRYDTIEASAKSSVSSAATAEASASLSVMKKMRRRTLAGAMRISTEDTGRPVADARRVRMASTIVSL